MSKELRDETVAAARAFVTRRNTILQNRDLSDAGRDRELKKANDEWKAETKRILEDLSASKQATKAQKTARESVTAEQIAAVKTVLQESADPGIEALEAVMQGDAEMLRVLNDDKGKRMFANLLKNAGNETTVVADMTTQISTAAQKRLSQMEEHLTPEDGNTQDQGRSTRFYDLVIPTLIADLGDAVEQGKRVVVVPNEEGDPDEILLTDAS